MTTWLWRRWHSTSFIYEVLTLPKRASCIIWWDRAWMYEGLWSNYWCWRYNPVVRKTMTKICKSKQWNLNSRRSWTKARSKVICASNCTSPYMLVRNEVKRGEWKASAWQAKSSCGRNCCVVLLGVPARECLSAQRDDGSACQCGDPHHKLKLLPAKLLRTYLLRTWQCCWQKLCAMYTSGLEAWRTAPKMFKGVCLYRSGWLKDWSWCRSVAALKNGDTVRTIRVELHM